MDSKIDNARRKAKNAIMYTDKWRDVAREDYEFVKGKQWMDGDLKILRENSRPAITINRCRPIVNLLCGYAAQNETEPDFLPRSEEDDSISRVAKGITKYTLDKTNYQRVKKSVFKDKIISGVGYYWLSYLFDYDKMEGLIKIERVSPFDVFIDPECMQDDLQDAEYVGRYSWESPDKLKQIYSDKSDEIDGLSHKLDPSENLDETERFWYSQELKKVRVVQYWYREYKTRKVMQYNGKTVDVEELKQDALQYLDAQMQGGKEFTIPDTKIRYMTFSDDVMLEDGDSPYKHKRYPLVRDLCYYTGENTDDDVLEPAGIIRDIKDAQRELNKNRSQRMHVVNQQALGVRFWFGQMTDKFKRDLKDKGTTPGANIEVPPGVTFQDGLPAAQSIGNMELEGQANSDFYNISGITPESLSGSIGAMSGKAIDLRQSVTTVQTAEIFDRSKEAERQLVQLLWGEQGRAGLIPQFYNEEKAIRILGEDGKKEFVQIRPGQEQAVQREPVVNPIGQPIVGADGNPVTALLYDLTKFDFDIIITTSMASATARRANLYQLLEAKKSGVDIPMDIILDFMDFPEKETVKKRIQDAAKAPKMPDIRITAPIKDVPAETLATALQSLGVSVTAQEIMAERLALAGKIPSIQPPALQMQEPQQQPQQMP